MMRLSDIKKTLRPAGLLADGRELRQAAATGAGKLRSNIVCDKEIRRVVFDSRDVEPGDCFVAIRGVKSDGHLFIDKAVYNGAIAIVCEAASAYSEEGFPDVAVVRVADSRRALLILASAMHGDPGKNMCMIGTTGTNGKTTVSTLVKHVLIRNGRECGLIGTTGYEYRDVMRSATTTTPPPTLLYCFLSKMQRAGVGACSMEVSSHALDQNRVRVEDFDVAIFTNLTRDHLDYHPSEQAYLEAKKKLFDGLVSSATAIINADHTSGSMISCDTTARIMTYGACKGADVRYRIIDDPPAGLQMHIDGRNASFRLAGSFNAENITAAYAAGISLGYSGEEVITALSDAPPVRGRYEPVMVEKNRSVIIDYAHTPDALQNVLHEARKRTPEGASLWCVFGCGGDRDAGKRPLMGAIAETLADHVIVTDDNPRTECSESIMKDIRAGMEDPVAVVWLADRRLAIRYVSQHSLDGDVVLIAGKGHETVQIVGTRRSLFDDRAEARLAFALTSSDGATDQSSGARKA